MSLKTILKKFEKKKKTYRKDYYPNYNKLLCRTTGCVPTRKGCNLPIERPPPIRIASIRCITETLTDYVSSILNDKFLLLRDGPPLELMSSESLYAISTTPNQE
ncbi:hypothetical protein AYI68_g2612 [Smittium mucronatum]|uniref:Uncharacterized protein n=1 Tax=Smittium mucronatum TaxID=133383 RepID=A0A1R0H2B0_9FUNG|nr:hypothetical protein AYI68_g2612 [Smittium mucronatum]